ncbi:MAG TPA: glycoside hydrolase family 57 protein [Candidatus Eisenbacteria bacterium]
MAARPILLALVWHMHQPSYVDPRTGRARLPWVRLHATKDYRDMVTAMRPHPRVHATFNLTPVLLDQIEAVASGAGDEWLDLARAPAASLGADARAAILRGFFTVNEERMLLPHPRYRELRDRAERVRAGGGPPLTEREWRDLQVWFHLAWVDPSYAEEEPIRSLLTRGREFGEEEKQALLDWGVALAGSVVGVYRDAAASGQIELAASAYHHPILPLLLDTDAPRSVSPSMPLPVPAFRAPEDASAQLRRARASHERRFGAAPRGTWPPEGAVSGEALALVRAAGFEWAASDETVLARALRERDGDRAPSPGALYRPYRVDTPAGPLAMLFRDRRLSDQIGFVYRHWNPEQAAEDFLDRVRRAGGTAGAEGPAVVTVILDGENCWEAYERDGHPFLTALYERLSAAADVEAVTVSEALERSPAVERLPRVPVGSWIKDDLAIWIGHPEKNRAWGALREAREAIVARGSAAPAASWDALYAAEASDWLWWYGDDHETAFRDEFDGLFRANLIRAYEALGATPPASLGATLRGAEAPSHPPGGLAYVRPTIDGRETDYFEWRGADRYEPAGAGGAMHRVTGPIARVLHGFDARSLYVRVDFVPGAERRGAELAVIFPERGVAARCPTEPGTSGALRWSPGERGVAGEGAVVANPAAAEPPAGDPGGFASNAIVELRLPLARAGSGPGGALTWRLAMERDGDVADTAPAEGTFTTRVPAEHLGLLLWSAT